MSPKTRILFLALFVACLFTLLLYFLNIEPITGDHYTRALFIIMIVAHVTCNDKNLKSPKAKLNTCRNS